MVILAGILTAHGSRGNQIFQFFSGCPAARPWRVTCVPAHLMPFGCIETLKAVTPAIDHTDDLLCGRFRSGIRRRRSVCRGRPGRWRDFRCRRRLTVSAVIGTGTPPPPPQPARARDNATTFTTFFVNAFMGTVAVTGWQSLSDQRPVAPCLPKRRGRISAGP